MIVRQYDCLRQLKVYPQIRAGRPAISAAVIKQCAGAMDASAGLGDSGRDGPLRNGKTRREACFAAGEFLSETSETVEAQAMSSARIASPQGLMISVAPQFRPFWRITPAGTPKA